MEITPELQVVIDAAVEQATSGLKTKNSDLIAREKAAKKAADEAEQAREAAATEAAEKAGDVETLRTQLQKKHDSDLKKLTDKLTAQDKHLSELLIDNAVAGAITANGVLPHFAPAVTLMLKNGAAVVDGVAMVGDKTLADHIEGWSKSNEAKHFIAAPNNTGAGATGSSAVASTWTKPPEGWEMDKWARDAVANPAEYNRLAQGWGRPDLQV